ncbi:mechanosensitive ion channel family protein [Frankia sp. CNm7]|uniref:Mechanosensitive ion channel family protein n=2 Tax=Frankia nepalensis TaxID=1836974 RepID=A0A937RLJ5_9ACTN|nr:mechanosensitive ion channel family protein [Frankia nepalensis]MBL7511441.1 mechanosensitive ion channel family protein [Frankia nepalensis]MBL7517044.1 mechanosensitive ion channel family protein [Frankia nepalensis]MBL7629544.1 mechanosensitive ion channel family protein [Frankia nepalensis]
MSLPAADSTPAVLVILAASAAAGFLLAFVLDWFVRRAGRRWEIAADMSRRGRRPLRMTGILLGLLVAANAAPRQDWIPPLVRILGLALIAGFAWLTAVAAFVLEDLALARYRTDVADNRHARRIRTQVTLVRRITTAVITIIAVAAMLMTFPSVRVAGASIFASAGVVGIVAGLAAQTSLANVFAGMQLAFTDAIRVDDVVVVEDEWGRIEEITLTYVVVHIWDDRRMILPSTYFTTTPFQNWTRRESAVLGAVELDLDWTVPTDELRTQLHAILAETDLWDGRVAVLQVTDAVAGYVRIRVLVSGKDGPTVFDLRCLVREALVRWLRENTPAALPRTRIESPHPDLLRQPDPLREPDWLRKRGRTDPRAADDTANGRENGQRVAVPPARDQADDRGGEQPRRPDVPDNDDARLFGGNPEADRRSRAFSETGDHPVPR